MREYYALGSIFDYFKCVLNAISKTPKVGVILSLGVFLFSIGSASAQDDSLKRDYVENVFANSQLINAQTTEMLPKGGWELKIQHRFGVIGTDSTIYHQFLGLDLPANIRFGFAFPISERWYWGVGRTKVDKTIDLETKYLLLKQTKDNRTPVSLAGYVNIMMRTDPFPSEPPNSFFADSTTAFEYKFSHKLSYNTQLIISRKFGNRLSLQIAPTFIYENLVEIGRENHTLVLPVSGRFRFGMLSSSLIFEYAPVLTNTSDDFIDPLSIGVEFGTAGHVFQLTISSSNYILEKNLYTKPSADYTEGEFSLGFNIKRTFWSKK